MTAVKTFVIGVLLGAIFGATFLGAISHLLVISLAVVGVGALALAGRRRRLERPSRKGLKAAPKPEA
jgi:uncharacterized membrane protein YdjX (TVP38/TMEM64 family)